MTTGDILWICCAGFVQRFYLVGSNESQTRFKILKIDKMPEMVEEHADPPTLNCVSDSGEYSASQIREVLGYISDSVEKLGGITLLHKAYGIFGECLV